MCILIRSDINDDIKVDIRTRITMGPNLYWIPFNNLLATSASNGGLIEWKIALFHKEKFW